MIEMNFRQEDARLVFLAIAYHLGRPGSELDPETKLPVEHGLAETLRQLQPQMQEQAARIDLNDDQLPRLLSAILGSVTELKAYRMLPVRPDEEGGGRRSSVPGFDRTLRHLYPEVDDDPELTMEIAEHMVMLRRRIDERLRESPPPEPEPDEPAKPKRKWWPFGG